MVNFSVFTSIDTYYWALYVIAMVIFDNAVKNKGHYLIVETHDWQYRLYMMDMKLFWVQNNNAVLV